MRAKARFMALVAALLAGAPAAAWDSQVPGDCRWHEQWNADWASEHNAIVQRVLWDLGVAEHYIDPTPSYPFKRVPRPSHKFTCATRSDHEDPGCAGSLDGVKGADSRYVSDLGAWLVGGRPAPGEEHPDKQREKCGDLAQTQLEERFVPNPHHFGELPDAVYTVYDWIGKASACPPFPLLRGIDHFAGIEATLNLDINITGIPSLIKLNWPYLFLDVHEIERRTDVVRSEKHVGRGCHRFKAWMGFLNSNHFGTQASNHYRAYHDIALWLARQAGGLRKQIRRDAPGSSDYDVYVEEAEREALIFEAVAQHYLTDRWSSGHMWERWGAPDFDQLRRRKAPEDALSLLQLAAVSGVLHGAEGLLGFPMPMCSPLINDEPAPSDLYLGDLDAEPSERCPSSPQFAPVTVKSLGLPEFRVKGSDGVEGTPLPAVGDHRFQQMLELNWSANFSGMVAGWWNPADYLPGDGYFRNCFRDGGKYLELNTKIQLQSMLGCARASMWEVIKTLGEGDEDGFGLHNINPSIPDLDEDGQPDNPPDLGRFDLRTVDGPCLGPYVTNRSFLRVLLAYGFTIPDLAASILMWPLSLVGSGIEGPWGYLIDELVLGGINDILMAPAEQTVQLALRLDFTRTLTFLKLAMKSPEADSTSWARNPGSMLGYESGDKYAFQPGTARPGRGVTGKPENARYLESWRIEHWVDGADLDGLEDFEPTSMPGRDKRTIYGFFNRAHAGYWCGKTRLEELPEKGRPQRFDEENSIYLEGLRGSTAPGDLEVCALLADRLYRRTGADFEVRKPKPICDVLTGLASATKEPQVLQVGYSARPNAVVDDPPWYGRYLRTIVNYCRRIPVVYITYETADVPDIGKVYHAELKPPGPAPALTKVQIIGTDFGETKPQVSLLEKPGTADEKRHERLDVKYHDNHYIEFIVPIVPEGHYALEVERTDHPDPYGVPLKSEPTAWIEVRPPVRPTPWIGAAGSLRAFGRDGCVEREYEHSWVPTINCLPLSPDRPCTLEPWTSPTIYAKGSAAASVQKRSPTNYGIQVQTAGDPAVPPRGAPCGSGPQSYSRTSASNTGVRVIVPIEFVGNYRLDISASGVLDQRWVKVTGVGCGGAPPEPPCNPPAASSVGYFVVWVPDERGGLIQACRQVSDYRAENQPLPITCTKSLSYPVPFAYVDLFINTVAQALDEVTSTGGLRTYQQYAVGNDSNAQVELNVVPLP